MGQFSMESSGLPGSALSGNQHLSNLQALCYSCNAMKRDRDTVDFRGMAARYRERSEGCIFCNIDAARIIAETELMVAVKDAFPVTEGHTLLIPKRHVASPNALFQPELNAMWALSDQVRAVLIASDPTIAGLNFGSNDGKAAGQTVMHAHFHVIPRRSGDVEMVLVSGREICKFESNGKNRSN